MQEKIDTKRIQKLRMRPTGVGWPNAANYYRIAMFG